MPQDLGQEAGEWLLNRRGFGNDAWKLLNAFISKAKEAMSEPQVAGQPDEIVAVDFEDATGAAEVSRILDGLGYENHQIGATIVMRGADLDAAAAACEEIARAIEPEAPMEAEQQEAAKDAEPAPSKAEDAPGEPERAPEVGDAPVPSPVPATENQIGYIERLAAEGHVSEADLAAARAEGFTTKDADALIKRGRAVRDGNEEPAALRVREEGSQARAASERLASERASQQRDRAVERAVKTR